LAPSDHEPPPAELPSGARSSSGAVDSGVVGEARPGGETSATAALKRPARGQREELLRAELEPLREDERPPALLVAIAVCALLALGVIVGAATIHDLRSRGGSLPGGAFLAIVLLLLAFGMYQRRYWAVLGFEALLAFQIIVTSLALVVASTIVAAAICVVSVGLGGWLFWKLVRVMGRIQAGEGH
jgi:hypothetical protein